MAGIEHHEGGRIELDGPLSPNCLIWKNEVLNDKRVEKEDNWIGDCEIKFYLGGKPIILHNDTTIDDHSNSLDEYELKLNKIKNMFMDVYEHYTNNPEESYLTRDFLNPYETVSTRLFGGTLLIHYSARWKLFTVDLCDCSNKTRKTYNHKSYGELINDICDFIEAALADVKIMRGKLNK